MIGPTAVSGARSVEEIKIIPMINNVIVFLLDSGVVNNSNSLLIPSVLSF
jgi:hypothetical protein